YVNGPAGTGRSRLLEAAASLAREAGMRVLTAMGRELERDFPFGITIQLLEAVKRAPAAGEPERHADDSPDLVAHLLDSAASSGDQDAGDRFATIHRLFALIQELAVQRERDSQAGLAILVDDAHSADPPSLELLVYVAARIADLPIALIASARDGASAPDNRGLEALRDAVATVSIETTDLSIEATMTMVTRTLPGAERDVCDACADATGGNPFLLAELLDEAKRLGLDVRDGAGEIAQLCPPTVVSRVRARLAELPHDAITLVHALAAIGSPATIEQAAVIAELDEAVAARAADALAAAGLVGPGVPLALACPLLGTAVRSGFAPVERQRLERRAAEEQPIEAAEREAAASMSLPVPMQRLTPTPAQRLAVAQLMVQGSIWGQGRGQIRHLARLAWGDGSLLNGPNPDAALATLLADALLLADDLELCLEIVGHPWFSSAEHDAPGVRARAGSCRAWSLYHQGNVPAALAEAEAVSAFLSLDRPSTAHSIGGVIAACLLQRRQLDEAEAALSMLERPDELTDLSLGVLLDMRAQLRLADGRPQEALEDAIEAGRRLQAAAGSAEPGIVAWRSTAALAKLALSEPDDARRLADEALEVAQAIDAPRLVIRALRVGGLALGGIRGLQQLGEAVEVGSQQPPRLEYVLSLVDYGAATRRANRRANARRLLTDALGLSIQLGLTAAATRARVELAALGLRRRTSEKEGIEALTASERRVADLTVAGRTTREMAAELFVTPKTIEFHLRNIYLKLNVPSSRAELVRVLRSMQPDGAES
ncbi:MAG: AAA family ATPase, partial [Solirubrobacteraceae bacterium]